MTICIGFTDVLLLRFLYAWLAVALPFRIARIPINPVNYMIVHFLADVKTPYIRGGMRHA